jgi:hypothetical protein
VAEPDWKAASILSLQQYEFVEIPFTREEPHGDRCAASSVPFMRCTAQAQTGAFGWKTKESKRNEIFLAIHTPSASKCQRSVLSQASVCQAPLMAEFGDFSITVADALRQAAVQVQGDVPAHEPGISFQAHEARGLCVVPKVR